MNKIISTVLLCSVLLICFSGCSIPNDSNSEKGSEQGSTPDINENKGNTITVIIEGEIDKSSDLVVTLVAYLEQYLVDYRITLGVQKIGQWTVEDACPYCRDVKIEILLSKPEIGCGHCPLISSLAENDGLEIDCRTRMSR